VTKVPYLQPGKIGRLSVKNRLVRAATSETMATVDGDATDPLAELYADLAIGGAGLILPCGGLPTRFIPMAGSSLPKLGTQVVRQ